MVVCGGGVKEGREDGAMTLKRVISGGQTGADQGGLEGAKRAGIETGGKAPRGYKTENGFRPSFRRKFGLEESKYSAYPPRTKYNVSHSDGTVIFGNHESPGCRLTARFCKEYKRPCLQLPYPGMTIATANGTLTQWCVLHGIETLNVAGNRESRNPGIRAFVRGVVFGVVGRLDH